MGPQNVIQGQQDPMAVPPAEIDDTQFEELKKTARFSKSAEFKELKKYIQNRMEFYRTYLPRGENPAAEKELSNEQLGENWRVANLVIGELTNLLGVYEQAADFVKDEQTRRNAMKKQPDGTA